MMCVFSQNDGLFEKRLLWFAGFESGPSGDYADEEGIKSQEPRVEGQEPGEEGKDVENRGESLEGAEGVDGGNEAVQPTGEELALQGLEITTNSDVKLMELLAAANSTPEGAEYPAQDIQSIVAERLQAGEAMQDYGPMQNDKKMLAELENNSAVVNAAIAGIVAEKGPENAS